MRKASILLIVGIILSAPILSVSSTIFIEPKLDWKAAVGDSMTFHYTKYYDSFDSDGNRDPHSTILSIISSKGENVNISIKKGLKVRAVITELGDALPSIQLSFNGISTAMRRYTEYFIFHGYVLVKTVDNQTYWDSKAIHTVESSPFSNHTLEISVEGENFVTRHFNVHNSGQISQSVHKRNWKTGWFTYIHSKNSNETHTLQEVEFSANTKGLFTNLISERIFILLMFLLTFVTIIIITKRRTG
ncbi:hypothetical protein CEE45_04425 [Candidatus Heimdallarchaeota archaeon B3_Heim]|nr:MAG: hypothetical protein CEE45_04425 [Candidatus Heimdallarchaeota archaeon B3_Heim]